MSSALILRTVSSMAVSLGFLVAGTRRRGRQYSPSLASRASGARRVDLGRALAPQPPRGDVGALANRFELKPYRRLDHPFALGEGAEAAIGRGDHALAVADGRNRLLDPP